MDLQQDYKITQLNRDRKIFSVLFLSIFTAVTGVGIVVPLLPVYARDLGASGLYIGMIFGAFSLSRIFFLPYFGRLSDRKGRKPFITFGLFCYALVSLAFLLSSDVASLIGIRFFQGIASAMIMPVTQAYVGDITPHGGEGFSMGLFNMSMFLGLSLGPVLGGVINDRFNLEAAFGAMGMLALAGFLFSVLFLPPSRQEAAFSPHRQPVLWRVLVTDRQVIALFLVRFAHTACIGIIWGFLPVFADAAFSLSSSAIGVLVMLGVMVSGIIHVPMGWVADRFNRRRLVVSGGLIVTAAVCSFFWADGFAFLVGASVVFGIGGGIAIPALMAMAVQRGSRAEAMGSVMAILTVAHSLGMLTGSLMAGAMMDVFDLRYVFPLGAVLMVASLVSFFSLTTGRMETA
jgi:MFS family permease